MSKRYASLRPYRADLPAAAQGASLAELLQRAHALAPKVQDRSFNKAGGEVIKGTKFEVIENALFLRVCISTPGEQASVVSNRLDVQQSDVALHQPPNEADYLDGDAFALIVGNHVVTCAAVARDSAIQEYCRRVIALHVSPDIGSVIGLRPAGSAKIAQQLERDGVDKVILNATTYKATALRHKEQANDRQKLLGRVISVIRPLFSDDEDDQILADNENLLINIEIRVDGKEAQKNRNRADFGQSGKESLLHFARAMLDGEVEEEEGFIIRTGSGAEIKGSEVRLKKQVRLDRCGKTFFEVDVIRALQDYYGELTRQGMLQQ